MKSNITINALNKNFKKSLAKKLANKLEMFYVDINDMLQYDLINIKQIINKAGIDYYNEVETKTIKTIASYENTMATINLDSFFNNYNYKILKETNLFIYIRVSFKDFKNKLIEEQPKSSKYEIMLDEKVFAERDNIFCSLSDIIVNVKTSDKKIEDKIIKEILKYYKEVL